MNSDSAKVDNYYAFTTNGEVGKLINISNNEYVLQVNNRVSRLNQSQFEQLIQISDIIFNFLSHPSHRDERLLATHKQEIDSFLKEIKVLSWDDSREMEYEVRMTWQNQLSYSSSNRMSSTTNHDKSLEYGNLYMGGDWRDDYDARC
ncbi:hypothetical protein H6G96_32735 [Nostoc sp. FACHB-892]|uniref:hypothetical protein n=1 Tax=Nostoc sp. FACHB-892 TaxID=2692843 RepID=UPI001687113E|nr:hypothetical protein [Nostoc sp. FACHB-892]MBD2730955.1 hypothetical protein [Nostoc sp. FACHB-892]